jgi:hypothetical protein
MPGRVFTQISPRLGILCSSSLLYDILLVSEISMLAMLEELLIEIDKVRNLYSFQDSIYCVVSMDGTVTTFLILQSSLLVSI